MHNTGANYLRLTMGLWKGDRFEKQPFKVIDDEKYDFL